MTTHHCIVVRLASAHRLFLLFCMGATVAMVTGCPGPTYLISGTIAVHGYQVDPNDILVRARPLSESADSPVRPIVTRATRIAGGSGSEFAFRLEKLAPGVPYRIGIKILNQDTKLYPRLVWRADRDPVVLAGDPALRFDAYAVLSQIEVMTTGEDPDRAEWVGADTLEFADAAVATRTFRWRSAAPNVTGGQLQISIKPYPRVGDPAFNPCEGDETGIVYRQDFEADVVPGRWLTLPPVDFNVLLVPRTADSPDGRAIADSAHARALDDPMWETQTLPKLEAGMPLYVRVLPKSGEEVLCDPERAGVPPEVILSQVLQEILESITVTDPEVSLGQTWYTKPEFGPRPYAGETCYRVIKDHKVKAWLTPGFTGWDALVAAYMSGVTYGQTALRGKSFCVPPDDDDEGWFESFTDSFGAVLTGIVDAIGDIANYTSKLWEEIQDEVVDAAASVIDNFVDCGQGSICRGALETGLEIGLATMGVPPSLPNFDALVDQGVDYLAAQVASQTGIPSVLTDYAAQEAKDFVQDVVANMKAGYNMPGLPDWLVPYTRFEPAYLTMELYGRGKSTPFNSTPRIIRNNTPIYAGAMVELPRYLPKKDSESPVLYPMVLPPNTYGLPEAPPTTIQTIAGPMTFYPSEYQKAVWNKNVWLAQRYTGGCYHLYLTALSNPGGIYELLSAQFTTADATVPCD